MAAVILLIPVALVSAADQPVRYDTPALWYRLSYALVAGALVISGIYNLTIFLLRAKERICGWLSAMCLSSAVNVLLPNTSKLPVEYIAPWFTEAVVLRFDLLTLSILLGTTWLLMVDLFPRDVPITLARSLGVFSAVIAAVGLTVPITVVLGVYRLFVALAGMYCVYFCYATVRALVLNRPDARLVAVGIAAMVLAGISDTLVVLGMIWPLPMLVPTALLVFTGILSFIVTRRFTAAYAATERLSDELREKNIALSRMDAIKDQFLATTSHELRTPLTGIIGIAESLPDAYPETPQGVRRNLTTIASSGRRLSALINDILDFSRLRNRDIRLECRPLHLGPVVRTVATVLAPLVQHKPVALRIDDESLDTWVRADEDRLQQILYNLVGNAVKFTDEGSVTIAACADGAMLRVSVSDTGPGIPREHQESIFTPFERGAPAESGRFSTGLGLGITRHLVELHGGAVSVTSEPGAGSTFSFTLPHAGEPADTPPTARARLTPMAEELVLYDSMVRGSPVTVPQDVSNEAVARVLVIDDEPVNLQVAVNQLTAAGYGVETCTNGAEALTRIEREPRPDLILLDLMMPGMSGYEVCERLRERFGQPELPVIIVTARNRISDLVRGFSAGANDYVTKPYSRDELLARVRTQLQLKSAFAALAENHRLKEELRQRVKREQRLRMLQRRLTEALDTIPLPVCAVDEAGVVVFGTDAAGTVLGHAPDARRGTPIDSLVIPVPHEEGPTEPLSTRWAGLEPGGRLTLDVTIGTENAPRTRQELQVLALRLDDEDATVLLFRDAGTATPRERATGLLIDELNRNRERLERLERSLHRLAGLDHAELDVVRNELRSIDTLLDQFGSHLQRPGTPVDRCAVAREIMALSLAYWEESTGETRLALARESGLWRVEVFPDGFERARTLDRYLDPRAFPKVPRWKKVLATGDFVLARCPESTPTRLKLEAALSRLRLA